MWVKICGITSVEDAIKVAEAGADAIGFVFAESPRKVTVKEVKRIVKELEHQKILKVGVFVNEDPLIVKNIAKECHLDILQFHGDESPSYCAEFDKKVIKAFKIKDKESVASVFKYKVDFYLLDTYHPDKVGGSGEQFNWELILSIKGLPIILAGGLNEDNVCEAIRKVNPFGVDVSSGVESSPGKKDINKVYRFIKRAKTCIT